MFLVADSLVVNILLGAKFIDKHLLWFLPTHLKVIKQSSKPKQYNQTNVLLPLLYVANTQHD